MVIREDACSTNGWNLLSTFLFIIGMALLLASLIVLTATWGNIRETMIGYAIAFVALAPFCLMMAWSHNRYAQKKSGYIEFDGNTLCYYERGSQIPVYSAFLEDCLWFRGARTWATLPHEEWRCQIVVGPQVILLQFPEWCVIPERKSGKMTYAEQPVIIAVGHTQKTRAEWESVLESQGIACDTTHDQKWLSPISSGLGVFWAIFCFGFFFVFSMSLATSAEVLMIGWNIHAEVAKAVGFSLFVPGCIFLYMWVGVFPLVYVKHRTGVHQPKISLAQEVTPAFTLLAFVVGSAILSNQFSFAWKLAYSISAATQCFVTFACYWFLVCPPKKSPETLTHDEGDER